MVASLEVRKRSAQGRPEFVRDRADTYLVVDRVKREQASIRRVRLRRNPRQVGNRHREQSAKIERDGALVRRMIGHKMLDSGGFGLVARNPQVRLRLVPGEALERTQS